MSVNKSGDFREPWSSFANIGYSVSLTRVLFPLPDTPETKMNFSKGNITSMNFKLFPDAPKRISSFPFVFRLTFGTKMRFFPDKYFPVRDFLDVKIFYKRRGIFNILIKKGL